MCLLDFKIYVSSCHVPFWYRDWLYNFISGSKTLASAVSLSQFRLLLNSSFEIILRNRSYFLITRVITRHFVSSKPGILSLFTCAGDGQLYCSSMVTRYIWYSNISCIIFSTIHDYKHKSSNSQSSPSIPLQNKSLCLRTYQVRQLLVEKRFPRSEARSELPLSG